MKKISLVLAMLLTLSLALTGCGASKSDAAMNGAAMDKGYFTNSGSSASMSAPVASVAFIAGYAFSFSRGFKYSSDICLLIGFILAELYSFGLEI